MTLSPEERAKALPGISVQEITKVIKDAVAEETKRCFDLCATLTINEVEAEREACAQVAEDAIYSPYPSTARERIAAAIRARGQDDED